MDGAVDAQTPPVEAGGIPLPIRPGIITTESPFVGGDLVGFLRLGDTYPGVLLESAGQPGSA